MHHSDASLNKTASGSSSQRVRVPRLSRGHGAWPPQAWGGSLLAGFSVGHPSLTVASGCCWGGLNSALSVMLMTGGLDTPPIPLCHGSHHPQKTWHVIVFSVNMPAPTRHPVPSASTSRDKLSIHAQGHRQDRRTVDRLKERRTHRSPGGTAFHEHDATCVTSTRMPQCSLAFTFVHKESP